MNSPSVSARTFVAALVVIGALALGLRVIFPAADPPWNPSVGVVWHDEGAWVHNARNKALFGVWTMDRWNPMYIAPVFTALEYVSFEALGVGVRQARLVSELTGFASVVLLALGVARLANREAGLIAGAMLATNYVYVMYDRAATMEAPMVAFMVAAWYCYVRAQARWTWGLPAAACALAAYFTKASAAFFVAALAIDCAMTLLAPRSRQRGAGRGADTGPHREAASATLAGLAVAGVAVLVLFVLPHWTYYWFYNWQISVTRKPSYDVRSLIDRVTWFPVLHDTFTRMWFVVFAAVAAVLGMLTRWRRAAPAERLLLWWIAVGTLELILHDDGNERRFLIFVPALVALAAILLGRDRALLPEAASAVPRARVLLLAPLVAYALYIVFGSIVRLAFIYEIRPNVRMAAALAALTTSLVLATWPRAPRWLARGRWTTTGALAVAALVCAGQLMQFVQWAAGRTYKNYEASIALGRVLPRGTLVHGKLANGLSLENEIRPIFVGRGFGNYEDRKQRDDVRYILTYIAPSLGYESQRANPVIEEVLDAYPHHRIVMTFDVAETTTGHDRAALIDKFGSDATGATAETGRAQD
jgi:dolichyl-phosphate-mannose-protein mannosyltransferase